MKRILRIIFNKYLLAIAGFTVWMLFFDENNLYGNAEKKRSLIENEQNIAFLQTENARMRKEITNMYTNRETLERYAREHFRMKRDNEDLYVVEKDR